jgi:hypothetical protein
MLVVAIALLTSVCSWYEPVLNRGIEDKLERPSSEMNEYEMEPGAMKPGDDMSKSEMDDVLNEYPPRPIGYNDDQTPGAEDALAKTKELDDLKKALNERLGTEDYISGLHDKDSWRKLHDYLKTNWELFAIDGKFSIPLEIRYVLCCYVILFIPGEFGFFIPGFYKVLIPRSAKKIEIINNALEGLDRFLKFVRKRSKETFLISFHFGRKNTLREDIEFIKRVPDLIFTEPMAIVREVLKFEIRADGYK